MIQLAILTLGATGAAGIALGGRLERWGFLAALAGQPFWIVETWTAGQWGMYLLACWYTCAWGYGAWRCWRTQ